MNYNLKFFLLTAGKALFCLGFLFLTNNIVSAADTIDVGAGARIYADGKFRDLAATTGVSAHLRVAPSGGTFATYDAVTTRPAWLDITNISNWTLTHKTWTESNAQSSVMVTDHTIGDLTASKWYSITITGLALPSSSYVTGINGTTCTASGTVVCQSDSSGNLSFRYSGGYSAHTFDMQEDLTAPTNVAIASIIADSATQLTITADTAVDSASGLASAPYWFVETTGRFGSSSSTAWQTSPIFVDANLTCGNQYSYKVKVKDANGNESDYSSIVSATLTNCQGGGTYTLNTTSTPSQQTPTTTETPTTSQGQGSTLTAQQKADLIAELKKQLIVLLNQLIQLLTQKLNQAR